MSKHLEKLDSLSRKKQSAFLGLFAGAVLTAQVARQADGVEFGPSFGKYECEDVADWRDFYGRELPSLGLTTFHQTEPRPALGMMPGSVVWNVEIGITDEGLAAREEYWARVNQPEKDPTP